MRPVAKGPILEGKLVEEPNSSNVCQVLFKIVPKWYHSSKRRDRQFPGLEEPAAGKYLTELRPLRPPDDCAGLKLARVCRRELFKVRLG